MASVIKCAKENWEEEQSVVTEPFCNEKQELI